MADFFNILQVGWTGKNKKNINLGNLDIWILFLVNTYTYIVCRPTTGQRYRMILIFEFNLAKLPNTHSNSKPSTCSNTWSTAVPTLKG